MLARWWAALGPAASSPCRCRPTPTTGAPHRQPGRAASRSSRRSTACRRPDPVASNVLAPEQYAILLDDLGAVDQHVRLQVYPHHLESVGDVVEWVGARR